MTDDSQPDTDDQAQPTDSRAAETAQSDAQSDEDTTAGQDTPAPSFAADEPHSGDTDEGATPTADGESFPRSVAPDAPTADGESIPSSVDPDAPPSDPTPGSDPPPDPEGVPDPSDRVDEADVDDDAAYEDQEWTLGEIRTGEIEVQGMRFKLEEPASDEAVERLLRAEGGLANNIREVVDTLVVSPTITDERWDNGMTPKERALLAGEALDWFGIDDFIDQEALAEAAAARDGQAGGPTPPGGPGGPRGPEFNR